MSDIKVGDTVEYIRADTPELTRGEHYVVVSDDRMECSSIAVHNNSGDVMWRLASRFRKVTETQPKEITPQPNETAAHSSKIAPKEIDWTKPIQTRVGEDARFLDIGSGGVCSVAVKKDEGWRLFSFFSSGKSFVGGSLPDLINVPITHTLTACLHRTKFGEFVTSDNVEDLTSVIAMKEITFTEGEGLD